MFQTSIRDSQTLFRYMLVACLTGWRTLQICIGDFIHSHFTLRRLQKWRWVYRWDQCNLAIFCRATLKQKPCRVWVWQALKRASSKNACAVVWMWWIGKARIYISEGYKLAFRSVPQHCKHCMQAREIRRTGRLSELSWGLTRSACVHSSNTYSSSHLALGIHLTWHLQIPHQ